MRVALILILFASHTFAQAPATLPVDFGATTQPVMRIEPVEYPPAERISPLGRARLQAEREAMLKEFLADASLDPDQVRHVMASAMAGATDTPRDNLMRIALALSQLNAKFKPGYDHYMAGRWAEASTALAPLMAETLGIKQRYKHDTMPPYAYTVTKFLYAECMGRTGDVKAAIIGYQVCFFKLPDNFTISATARQRVAELYEQTARSHWSIPIYRELLSTYGTLLVDSENLRLAGRISALAAVDPYRLGLRKGIEVRERLARGETGPEIQKAQADLVRLLVEMQAMYEEEERPFLESTQTIAQGAETGSLEKGTAGVIQNLGNDVARVGNDDWGQLRPRERQQLLQTLNEQYPERYRQMLERYYREMSARESEQQE